MLNPASSVLPCSISIHHAIRFNPAVWVQSRNSATSQQFHFFFLWFHKGTPYVALAGGVFVVGFVGMIRCRA
jgi:hypothetical protein